MKPILSAFAAILLFMPSAAHAEVKIHDPISYETASGMTVGGALMGLHSDTDDRLTGASSPVCDHVEIHSMTEDNGVMKMRKQDGLNLPAGQVVALSPTGYHLMLIGLKEPLKAGQQFPLTLTFEKAGKVDTTVTVKPRTELKKSSGAPAGHAH
jgi:copper(I)-binding protein